jgi:hypothetical protein
VEKELGDGPSSTKEGDDGNPALKSTTSDKYFSIRIVPSGNMLLFEDWENLSYL